MLANAWRGDAHPQVAIFAEQGVELEPYPLAEELRQRSVTSGPSSRPRRVQLSLHAHRSAKLRHIRAAHIQGGDGLQVLNVCLFPHLEFDLPTFSADLVTLPGGHLIAIDCQLNDPGSLSKASSSLSRGKKAKGGKKAENEKKPDCVNKVEGGKKAEGGKRDEGLKAEGGRG